MIIFCSKFTSKSRNIWSRKRKKRRRVIRHHPALLPERSSSYGINSYYSHHCTAKYNQLQIFEDMQETGTCKEFQQINPPNPLDQLLRGNKPLLNRTLTRLGVCSCQELHPSRTAGRKTYRNGQISPENPKAGEKHTLFLRQSGLRLWHIDKYTQKAHMDLLE